MSKRIVVGSFIVIMFAAGATVASAQGRGWRNLGTKEVTDRLEEDNFDVRSYRGQFSRLRFRVGRNPVRIERMVITYTSGERDEIQIQERIGAYRYSRIIDVEGQNRYIRNVRFWWAAASLGRGRNSTVTLYGRR